MTPPLGHSDTHIPSKGSPGGSPEAIWRLALQCSEEGVWDWDLVTNTIYFSDHAVSCLGFDPRDMNSMTGKWTHLMHPADHARTMRALVEHLDGKRPVYRVEHRIRHRDGTYRWISARGAAIRDEEGRPIRLVGVSSDITERKQIELKLRQREELLRAAVEGSLDIFFILKAIRNHDGRIEDFVFVDLNRKACDFAGISREEALNESFRSNFPFAIVKTEFARYVHAADAHTTTTNELVIEDASERRQWLHQEVVPVRDGIAVTIADITVRKEAENALHEKEHLVKRITASMPELIYVFDFALGRCTYRNRSLLASLGYASEDAPMLDIETLARICHPEDLHLIRGHFHDLVTADHDDILLVTLRLIDAHGEERWHTIRSMVFSRDENGLPTQALGSSQDITENKLFELHLRDQMRQLQEAREELEVRHRELMHLNMRLGELATRDGLTDVYNHRAFREKLVEEVARATRRGEPLSVIITDVDDFKRYNDRFGHPAGDDRLRDFVRLIQAQVRTVDFLARYGGEEFVLVLPNTNVQDAEVIARRILDSLNELEGLQRFTASFGCAELDPSRASAEQIVRDADQALLAAKAAGKNRIHLAGFCEV